MKRDGHVVCEVVDVRAYGYAPDLPCAFADEGTGYWDWGWGLGAWGYGALQDAEGEVETTKQANNRVSLHIT